MIGVQTREDGSYYTECAGSKLKVSDCTSVRTIELISESGRLESNSCYFIVNSKIGCKFAIFENKS